MRRRLRNWILIGAGALCVVFSIAVFVSNYSTTPDDHELPGDYAFELQGVRQTIKIQAGGTYVNSLFLNDALAWSDQGRWSPDSAGQERGITLEKFRFGIEGHSSTPGFWFVAPEKDLFGRISLCFDPDLYRCFNKAS